MNTDKINQHYKKLYDEGRSENIEQKDFYKVSCRLISDELSYVSLFTEWVGHEGKKEIRRADLISPTLAKKRFQNIGISLAVVESKTDLSSYLRFGGHALIEKSVVEKYWSEILNPKLVVNTYEEGYIDYESISDKYKKRFARGPFRIEVFRRDNYQCKICGSSPEDNVHVRLEAHHILPWEEGGVTSPENLITLCATCHAGVGRPEREILYRKIGLHFPYTKHKLFEADADWGVIQELNYTYIMSNEVTIELKKR